MLDRILEASLTLLSVAVPVLVVLTYIKVDRIERKLKDKE